MYSVILTTLFGLEALVREEATQAGLPGGQMIVSDGEVVALFDTLEPAAAFAARMNFRSRCAERVFLELGRFPATTFDQLFDGCQAIPWENYLDEGMEIVVNGYSRQSQLFGLSACQKLIKKSVSSRLAVARHIPGGLIPEDRNKGRLNLRFSIVKDQVSLSIDTTGVGLHKRGYRPQSVEAPLRETLASAILQLSFFNRGIESGEVLIDPFCGSGTFLVEAAYLLRGKAPGVDRHFAGENYRLLMGQALFDRERELAKKLDNHQDISGKIYGQDVDGKTLQVAKKTIQRAGFGDAIQLRRKDIRKQTWQEWSQWTQSSRQLVVTNPPYGERLLDEGEADALLAQLGSLCLEKGRLREGVRLSLITPSTKTESLLGAPANKRRKLYNGGIPCQLYHYFRNNSSKKKPKRESTR